MAKKVGSVYAEIRADIKKLQQDFDKAHAVTQTSAKKIQATLDKGISFDKMAAGAVAAGASMYTAFRMVGQAIESAKVGSTLDKQSKAFANLSDAAGTSSKRMLDSLKASSQGMVAESDLMAAAGKAMLMNIPADKISELMKIAAATSKMTGQSITDAFNDITMGVARQSRMILDNLGIIVNVDDANRKYAKALGTTADALDDAQKRQAFMNAVLEAGADMIKRLGSSSGALDGVNKLVAAQADLWAQVNKTVASFLDKELSGYAKMLTWIAEKLKSMGVSSGEASMESARKEIEMLRSLESKGMAQPGSTMNKMAEFNKRWGGASEAELAAQRSHQEWQKPDPMASWREREGNFAANTEEQNKAILKGIEDERKAREKASEDELKWMDTYNKAVMSEFEFERATLDARYREYEKFVSNKKKLDEWYHAESWKIKEKEMIEEAKRMTAPRSESYAITNNDKILETEKKNYEDIKKQREKIAEEDRIANDKRWADVYASTESAMGQWIELTERTAAAMQENFSNLFFDSMTGELKTLEDYADAVFKSIARMVSDLAAQTATELIFGNLSKSGGGGGGGGLLGSIIGMFGGNGGGYPGGNPYGQQTGDWGAVAHAGGTVGVSGGPMRSIPSHYFSTAPRLHQGLAADEFPAVLQKGEQVIPKGKGGKSQPVVHMHFYSQSGKYDRESVSQAQSGLYASLSRANRRNS